MQARKSVIHLAKVWPDRVLVSVESRFGPAMPVGPTSTPVAAGLRVLLCGASGLVGGQVLQALLHAELEVLAPSRRPLPHSAQGLCNPQFDAERALRQGDRSLDQLFRGERAEVWICALGTTRAQAGSSAAFAAIDRDLVLRFASIARRIGVRHAILVSSVGAHPRAGSFYLRVKAEAERGLAEQNFPRVDILRPGLLLGPRREPRRAETVGKVLMSALRPVLLGPLARYRAIEATQVAAAALALARSGGSGWFVHHYTAMEHLANRR